MIFESLLTFSLVDNSPSPLLVHNHRDDAPCALSLTFLSIYLSLPLFFSFDFPSSPYLSFPLPHSLPKVFSQYYCSMALGRYINATMTISVEEISAGADEIELQLSGVNLRKMDLFGKSDPFFEIFKKNPGTNEFIQIYQSEVVKFNLNPVWNKISLVIICMYAFLFYFLTCSV